MQVAGDIVNENFIFNVVDESSDRNARMTFKCCWPVQLMHNARQCVLVWIVRHIGVEGRGGDGGRWGGGMYGASVADRPGVRAGVGRGLVVGGVGRLGAVVALVGVGRVMLLVAWGSAEGWCWWLFCWV